MQSGAAAERARACGGGAGQRQRGRRLRAAKEDGQRGGRWRVGGGGGGAEAGVGRRTACAPPAARLPRIFFKAVRFTYSRLFPVIHWLCDRHWPQDKIVKTVEDVVTAPFYVVIAAVARKD